MKYALIFALIVVLLRADFFLGLIDKFQDKLQNRSASRVTTQEISPPSEIIPIAEDRNLKQTPRSQFFALLENFQFNPSEEGREAAMVILQKNPLLLNPKLDLDFERAILRWRDLVSQNNPQLPLFLNDLLNTIQGENLQVLKRFYTLIMDQNMESFLLSYSKTKDTNCTLAGLHADDLPEETQYTQLSERERFLNEVLAKEGLSPQLRLLAQNCQNVLKIEIAKLPPPAPITEPSADDEENP